MDLNKLTALPQINTRVTNIEGAKESTRNTLGHATRTQPRKVTHFDVQRFDPSLGLLLLLLRLGLHERDAAV